MAAPTDHTDMTPTVTRATCWCSSASPPRRARKPTAALAVLRRAPLAARRSTAPKRLVIGPQGHETGTRMFAHTPWAVRSVRPPVLRRQRRRRPPDAGSSAVPLRRIHQQRSGPPRRTGPRPHHRSAVASRGPPKPNLRQRPVAARRHASVASRIHVGRDGTPAGSETNTTLVACQHGKVSDSFETLLA